MLTCTSICTLSTPCQLKALLGVDTCICYILLTLPLLHLISPVPTFVGAQVIRGSKHCLSRSCGQVTECRDYSMACQNDTDICNNRLANLMSLHSEQSEMQQSTSLINSSGRLPKYHRILAFPPPTLFCKSS